MQTDILTVGFVSLLAGAIRMSIPILLPALGEIFTQRSGILNLGLEGIMLMGAFAGLGGAFLSIGFMNTFLDGMVAGRGFIAVAVVIFARWNPYRALGAALLFGGASALQMRLQAIGVPIPHQFLLALPYVLTILVLLSVSKKAEFPAAYTLPYSRSER